MGGGGGGGGKSTKNDHYIMYYGNLFVEIGEIFFSLCGQPKGFLRAAPIIFWDMPLEGTFSMVPQACTKH